MSEICEHCGDLEHQCGCDDPYYYPDPTIEDTWDKTMCRMCGVGYAVTDDDVCKNCADPTTEALTALAGFDLISKIHLVDLLVSIYFALRRTGWEAGETVDQVNDRIHSALCEILGDPFPNLGVNPDSDHHAYALNDAKEKLESIRALIADREG